MARLSGVEIPRNKRIVVSLTYIHGIGRSLAEKICQQAKITPDFATKKLSDSKIVTLQNIVNTFAVEGEVRRRTSFDVKRLKEIGCYRGVRHRLNLPVRGQSTRKNARTRKGPRKTVANKKKVDAKT